MKMNGFACIVLMEVALLLREGLCLDRLSVLSSYLSDQITVYDPNLSECCNDINESCLGVHKQCEDYMKPNTLVFTCRCIPTAEFEMIRVMDDCMERSDERIKTRLEKELNRVVIRKMPKQTGEPEGPGYVLPGKNPDAGAKQPKNIGVGIKGALFQHAFGGIGK